MISPVCITCSSHLLIASWVVSTMVPTAMQMMPRTGAGRGIRGMGYDTDRQVAGAAGQYSRKRPSLPDIAMGP